ncbi:hypothetical protein ACEWY4_022761 [Coilia grayii]|uniref:Ig-like domain-containing protein n=1 Tax=Coilia grayii TaxID=363190 RepID=A0ABD1J129_9TELE
MPVSLPDVRITQPYRVVATGGEARIECRYASPPHPHPEELHVTLLKGLHGEAAVCEGYLNTTQLSWRTREPNACHASVTNLGVTVTVSGLKGEDTDLYRCLLDVIYPPPYLRRFGNGTLVYVPGERETGLFPAGDPVTPGQRSGGLGFGSGPGNGTDADPEREAGVGSTVGGAALTSGAGSSDSDRVRHHLPGRRD